MEDKFLFKTYPLLYRTWIYHSLIRESKVLEGAHDENQMMNYVFSQFCIDGPIMGGRASPLPYFVPLAIGTCLTGNVFLVVLTVVVIAILLFVARSANKPEHYRKARAWTSPLRVGYFGVVVAVLDFSHFLALVGFVVTLGALVADFITGDMASLYYYRMHCTYDVIKSLPGRLSVCFRHGAAEWEHFFGHRGCVDECISSFGAWGKCHHLIVDIGDMLMELRPLNREDWEGIRDQYYFQGLGIPYVALDVFDMDELASTAASMSSTFNRSIDHDMTLEDF